MLGSPILYLKAMRILMFQLSGFYCRFSELEAGFEMCIAGFLSVGAGYYSTLNPTPYTLNPKP